MKELEQAKQIFLDETLDEETRKENAEKIAEWERTLIKSEHIESWRSHVITKEVFSVVKDEYKNISLRLIHDRTLSDQERMSLWAKQDACIFIISLASKNARNDIEQVRKEINVAISATL